MFAPLSILGPLSRPMFVATVSAGDEIIAWDADGRWIYCPTSPFLSTSSAPNVPDGTYITITGGTGWTPGDYSVSGAIQGFGGTQDGSQNMLQLSTAPTAPGTRGGQGFRHS